ncbi:MAG TPA: GNAT family N-acetyltransferase [Candidatus Limnocylindrales bacterium]|nr:GNAT family N-acetyltransferase [Candidatus Limnocylindrales bacterium]
MTEVRVRRLVEPTDAEVDALAGLFDAYRAHYGEPVDPGGSRQWLAEHLRSGRLSAFVADLGGELVGFACTMDVPASLRLAHYWQVRDLFVVPGHRRVGVARALLDVIRSAAAAAGALRLAVQTEDDNAIARQLYEGIGFDVVEGYVGLTLPLVSGESG